MVTFVYSISRESQIKDIDLGQVNFYTSLHGDLLLD